MDTALMCQVIWHSLNPYINAQPPFKNVKNYYVVDYPGFEE
ncbi:MAG: hypothetical protein ACETWM_17405 [Candidatus Lokiarchaeia archaeon]